MFKDVSFLIPYKSDNDIRDVNFTWIKEFYKIQFPEAEICVGISTEKLFNRAQAINNAAKKATRNIFAIVDGDMFCDPVLIKDSVELLEEVPWVIPFRKIFKISASNSYRIIGSAPIWPLEVTEYEMIHTSKFTHLGGMNIIPREHFMAVGGFDERFSGWCGEDDAFGTAVNTMCGHYARLEHTVFHLWHPAVGYENNPNGKNNLKLRELYYEAKNDKKKMERVLSNAKSIFRISEGRKPKKNEKDAIHIATAANDMYAEPLTVMLYSLLKNKTSKNPVHIYVIESNISEFNKARTIEIANKFKATIEFKPIDPDIYDGFSTFAYITQETYYRISIPDLLDESIDKVLYLDCDLVVKQDITRLWNKDIRRFFLGAVEDSWIKQSRNEDLFMAEGSKYFNAGVLLINLKKWREYDIKNNIVDFIQTYPANIKYCDQDALNAVLHGRWRELGPKWNYQTFLHISNPNLNIKPAIIHYTGENKPWNSNHPLKKTYRRYRSSISNHLGFMKLL